MKNEKNLCKNFSCQNHNNEYLKKNENLMEFDKIFDKKNQIIEICNYAFAFQIPIFIFNK